MKNLLLIFLLIFAFGLQADTITPKANIYYTYDDDIEYADGKQKGTVEITSLPLKDINSSITYSLEAKQGVFLPSKSKSVTFTKKEYLQNGYKKTFRYKTYRCSDPKVEDKRFETFTLKLIKYKDLKRNEFLKKEKVPFLCNLQTTKSSNDKNFFTAIIKTKLEQKVLPNEKVRGIDKPLTYKKIYKDVLYLYIDEKDGKIVQFHIDQRSNIKVHDEEYRLNIYSCKFELIPKDYLVKNIGSTYMIHTEDNGWGFDNNTLFNIPIVDSNPTKNITFKWGQLKNNGSFQTTQKAKSKIPNLAKNFYKEFASMAKIFKEVLKESPLIDIAKAGLDSYASIDKKCHGKVTLEGFNKHNMTLQDTDITVTLKIKRSEPDEIRTMKSYMKKYGTSAFSILNKELDQHKEFFQGE